MDLDDLPPESGVGIAAAAVAALLLSSRLRGLVRRGAVAGLAALLSAGDSLAERARRLEGGAHPDDGVSTGFAQELVREARGQLAGRGQQPGHQPDELAAESSPSVP